MLARLNLIMKNKGKLILHTLLKVVVCLLNENGAVACQVKLKSLKEKVLIIQIL